MVGPLSTSQYSQSSTPNGLRLRDNTDSLSDDSTQPPDVIFETEFSNLIVDTGRVLGATFIINSGAFCYSY